ncbi:DUF2147 domain-containing protein [Flavobacteriaceae bacterium]|nr:DUF2147 domain-containing protein [Flavobacteriaceae bacterium]MDB4067495.1 DUF2147 domain-containing protein [Flavobacteriaceae bacterium]
MLATYFLFLSLFIQTPDFEGNWVTIDDETGVEKSIIKLYIENDTLYGRIETLLLEEDQDQLCTNCTGSELNQPIEGLIILKGLTRDGEQWTGGTILDPANGKEYQCTLTLEGDSELNVRGFIGFSFIGRTQRWKRMD